MPIWRTIHTQDWDAHMKVNKQMTLDVQEAYRVITGKHVNAWAIRTRSYVSVKLQGRHLSTSEAARFAETMRKTFGKDFLTVKNAHARKPLREAPPHRGITIEESLRGYYLDPKVTVRFVSTYEDERKPVGFAVSAHEEESE